MRLESIFFKEVSVRQGIHASLRVFPKGLYFPALRTHRNHGLVVIKDYFGFVALALVVTGHTLLCGDQKAVCDYFLRVYDYQCNIHRHIPWGPPHNKLKYPCI